LGLERNQGKREPAAHVRGEPSAVTAGAIEGERKVRVVRQIKQTIAEFETARLAKL
jgi:hypothetical protein